MTTDTTAQRWLDAGRRLGTHPRSPHVAAAALVAVLGWQLAELTWMVTPAAPPAGPPEASPGAGAAAAPADGGGGPSDPSARLAALHLFGSAPTGGAVAPSGADAATDAPETQLNLTLKGVYAPGSGEGLAIIAAGGGGEKVFALGDTIAGNARITGIYADRVVLRRNGRAETLRMSLASAPAGRGTGASARGGASAQEQRIAQRARELRRRLLENPVELARMVRFQPYVQDGQLVGYRIQPRSADASLLRDLGLRPSDVITRLNGNKLNNPGQANQALQSLRDARTIEVTFLRDGQQQRMSIPIGGGG